MHISIFGMGYVCCVLAAGHFSQGHSIIGVDVNDEKLSLLKRGESPVFEPGMQDYISKAIKEGKLNVSADAPKAVIESDISLVCVGTPSKESGEIDLTHTESVCKDISTGLKKKNGYHVIAFKSTLFPGTIESIIIPILEESGKKAGKDFGVCHNPEFLREGRGMHDFFHPPVTVIGQYDKKSGDLLSELYKGTEIVRTSVKIGEMIKYVNNSFHGLKVSFANEIGRLSKSLGIDSHELMNIFCMDKELNISSYYLTPGVPFGGSCLTKDIKAMLFEARKRNIRAPVLEAIDESNQEHIDHIVSLVEHTGKKRIGVLGLSFKENTDDLRSSAIVSIIDRLKSMGKHIRVYDPHISKSRLFGVNKGIFEEKPYLGDMLSNDINTALDCDVIIVKNKIDEFKPVIESLPSGKIVIDLVRITNETKANYNGVCC